MELDYNQIKSITNGAVRITQEEDGFHFFRFTKKQEELYEASRDISLSRNTYSTSGVQIRFKTDSRKLHLDISAFKGNNRNYFALDVLVNNRRIGSITNYDESNLPPVYPVEKFPFGAFSGDFDLNEGIKEVKILFPWSAKTVLQKLILDDGAMLEGIKPKKKFLCFGDSITQGYDSLHPSNKHITRLADFLDAEEFNKAIGGEQFFPELAKTKEPFEPDAILVGYGTNNWTWSTKEELTENCNLFYGNLRATYPNAKIFALAPIWRKDCADPSKAGEFAGVAEIIKEAVAKDDNITFIQTYDFVPHKELFFADLKVHPNDNGFEEYYKNLIKIVHL